MTNSYYLPENVARQVAEEQGIPISEAGSNIPLGIAYPVLIAIGVTLIMTFVANRLRFGRYVFSIGGNPGHQCSPASTPSGRSSRHSW